MTRGLAVPTLGNGDTTKSVIQAKLDQLAAETGVAKGEFVQDALAGYFEELLETREVLERRYDEVKSGRVKLVSSDEVIACMHARSAARRVE